MKNLQSFLKCPLNFVVDCMLWLINSIFGWMVCGGTQKESDVSVNFSKLSSVAEYNEKDVEVDNLLRQFWEIEEFEPETLKPENVRCNQYFSDNVNRDSEGRYVVKMPFKNAEPNLGNSYYIALKQFRSLEKRLESNTKLKEIYLKFMDDYESCGHMRKLEYSEIGSKMGTGCYTPHHGILQQSQEKVKLRVVFNASCKTSNGVSLNDELLPGCNLQIEMFNLLLYVRKYRFIFSADVKQMFRQITICESDQKFQKILWRQSADQPLSHYKLTTVTYGTVCAPFLAMKVLRHHASLYKYEYPLAFELLTKRTYMDDIFAGSNSIEKLINIKEEIIKVMKLGGFELKKWMSNTNEVIKDFPHDDLAKPELLDMSNDRIVKTLGLHWRLSDDYFIFKLQLSTTDESTKRQFLSSISRIYDPMGWLSPVTITLKIMFQELWIKKLSWDDVLPPDFLKTWTTIKNGLIFLKEIEIPRWIGSGRLVELHGFSDASAKAYGAVVYARVKDFSSNYSISILASKTRVAPLKKISIPRLELCAAQLLSQLMKIIIDSLADKVLKIYCWTDSEIVLAWLTNSPSKWKPFVFNRVTDVLTKIPEAKWSYVSTKENPADVASRGMSPEKFKNFELWWNGPTWLGTFMSNESEKLYNTDLEKKKSKDIVLLTVNNDVGLLDKLIARYSSYNRLVRTLAYILRFKWNATSNTDDKRFGELTVDETDKSLSLIIRHIQMSEFANDINRCSEKGNVSIKSQLYSLSPFLDKDQILRVGGRLQNAFKDFTFKHPIILKCNHFVDILILYEHNRHLHAGVSFVVNEIRQNFWIIKLKQRVKKILKGCIPCIKAKIKTYTQRMGALPLSRVQGFRPFLKCGVDFAGPILLRPYKGRGKITVKGYICVFVCLATRALHLELVMGLSAENFIYSLQRFISTRGHVQEIMSDNGKNFIGAVSSLQKAENTIGTSEFDSEVERFMTNNHITWKFIPVASPNYGGIWEAGVRSVKDHIKRSFGEQILTIEEIQTILCQIEGILNSRPLTAIQEDPCEPQVLTPAHFIIGETFSTTIFDRIEPEKFSLGDRYRLMQEIVKSFWSRWNKEYLNTLQIKSKWKSDSKNAAVGDLVIIKRNQDAPKTWSRGIITKVYPGSDELVRTVEVRKGNKTTVESVRNLIPLNVEACIPQPGADC